MQQSTRKKLLLSWWRNLTNAVCFSPGNKHCTMYQICSTTVCHQKKSLTEKRWTLIECRVIFDVEKACRSAFPMHDIGKIGSHKLALWFPYLRVRQYCLCAILVGVSLFFILFCNHRVWVVHSGMLVTEHADDSMSILGSALAIIGGELCILVCWWLWSCWWFHFHSLSYYGNHSRWVGHTGACWWLIMLMIPCPFFVMLWKS